MNYAVIFAGGTGTRMNSKAKPKQFLTMHGKEIIVYTLERFEDHPEIDGISIACIKDWLPYMEELVKKYNLTKVRWISPGGSTGQESIFNGLHAMKHDIKDEDLVLIHDGVRPLIDDELISDNIKMAQEKGCAVTAVPAVETVMIAENNEIVKNVDRKKCRLVKAPQTFKYGEIMQAHDRAKSEGNNNIVDSATMMSMYGCRLYMVEGKSSNIKITTPFDYYTFRALLEAEENTQVGL